MLDSWRYVVLLRITGDDTPPASIGLSLNEAKGSIRHTLDGDQPGFSFLGFDIRQYRVGKHQSGSADCNRLNLGLHQRVAALRRRSATSCKSNTGLTQPLVLFQVYYNFVLPHASLRQPLNEPAPTNGTGSAKVWRPCTLAMAAGLTNHVWSLQEVLMFRVPPWPQPQMV
jgi:hypothetical protein